MSNKREFTVFSQTLAGFLMMRGFVLKRMTQSKKDFNRNVFIFNESDELLNALKEYQKPNNRKIKDTEI